MKVFREISNNWNKEQVELLRQYGIDVEVGCNWFRIYDVKMYLKLQPLFRKWEVLDTHGTSFSKKEILSAEYCVIERCKTCGYPMPDDDQSYLYNTYETKCMCCRCGIGAVQKDDFRVNKIPKYPIWELGWIYDELFVRNDIYEKIFKPIGVESRPLKMYKNDSVIESYVQLVIPTIDESLDLSNYESLTCNECGMTKYDPMTYGYYPLQEHPLSYIYKSKEFFGDGFSASRKIFISAAICEKLIENRVFPYHYFVPCSRTEDLCLKNKPLQDWPKPDKSMGYNTSIYNIAISD